MTILPGVKSELLRAALRLSAPAVVLPSVQAELLRAAASLKGAPVPFAAPPRHSGHRIARPIGAAVAVVCAAALATVLLLGSPRHTGVAHALPVLKGPKHDIRALRRRLMLLARRGAAFDAARVISTPGGTGYVVPTGNGQGVCLAVPADDGAYGQVCAANDRAEALGLALVITPRTGSTGEIVAVLPAGDVSVTLEDPSGATRPMEVSAARVVAERVLLGSRATMTVDGRTRVLPVPRNDCPVPQGTGHLLQAPC